MTDKPNVGDLATMYCGTDRTPYTVIQVSKSGHRITLQERKSKRLDSNGMSEDQRYITLEDSEGRECVATRRKDGEYRLKGCDKGYGLVKFGIADKYHDYSF